MTVVEVPQARGGKTRSVLFGKKIANKVAEKFATRLKLYRPYPPE